MKFEEVLSALRDGKKIRRKDVVWQKFYGFLFISETKNKIFSDNVVNDNYRITKEDLCTDDWEIVKEMKKVKLRDLTEEQFSRWLNANCEKLSENCCSDCPFNIVDCISLNDTCRLKHKDLFSYKFLDQEVEVEE